MAQRGQRDPGAPLYTSAGGYRLCRGCGRGDHLLEDCHVLKGCYNCGSMDHWHPACPFKETGRVCKLCHQPGHEKKNCPLIVCENCNCAGHLKRNCRWKRCLKCRQQGHMAFECLARDQRSSELAGELGAVDVVAYHQIVLGEEAAGIGAVDLAADQQVAVLGEEAAGINAVDLAAADQQVVLGEEAAGIESEESEIMGRIWFQNDGDEGTMVSAAEADSGPAAASESEESELGRLWFPNVGDDLAAVSVAEADSGPAAAIESEESELGRVWFSNVGDDLAAVSAAEADSGPAAAIESEESELDRLWFPNVGDDLAAVSVAEALSGPQEAMATEESPLARLWYSGINVNDGGAHGIGPLIGFGRADTGGGVGDRDEIEVVAVIPSPIQMVAVVPPRTQRAIVPPRTQRSMEEDLRSLAIRHSAGYTQDADTVATQDLYYRGSSGLPEFNPRAYCYKIWEFDEGQMFVEIEREKLGLDTCAICFATFNDKEDEYFTSPVVRINECEHAFHEACLLPSLNVKSFCPLCRRIITITRGNFVGAVKGHQVIPVDEFMAWLIRGH